MEYYNLSSEYIYSYALILCTPYEGLVTINNQGSSAFAGDFYGQHMMADCRFGVTETEASLQRLHSLEDISCASPSYIRSKLAPKGICESCRWNLESQLLNRLD